MNALTHTFKHKVLKYSWYSVLLLTCIVPMILAIIYAPIVPDTAYYLSIVERINDGILPYRDLALGYTPLVFYITYGIKKLFGIGINYEFFLSMHFIIQIVCSYIVYLIGLQIINSKKLSFYAALFFLILSHWNEGNFFLLETPSIFFGLIAIFLTLKNSQKLFWYLLIGLLCSFSFLSKQYGLGFLGLVVYLLIANKTGWKAVLGLFIGFALPIIACYFIWGNYFFSNIFNSYGEKRTMLLGLMAVLKRTSYLVIRVPILIAAFYFILKIWTKISNTQKIHVVLMVLAIGGFMLQFYFAKFAHYFLFALPFVAILTFHLMSLYEARNKTLNTIIAISVLMSVYATYHDQVYKLYYLQKEKKMEQYQLAKEILSSVDNSKHLYIADIGLIHQYYLTNMTPPNLKTIGYTFAIALTEKTHLQQINNAAYVLKYKTEYNHYNLNTEKVQNTLHTRPKKQLNKEVVLYQ